VETVTFAETGSVTFVGGAGVRIFLEETWSATNSFVCLDRHDEEVTVSPCVVFGQGIRAAALRLSLLRARVSRVHLVTATATAPVSRPERPPSRDAGHLTCHGADECERRRGLMVSLARMVSLWNISLAFS